MLESIAHIQSRGGVYIHIPFCYTVCPYCDFAVLREDRRKHAEYLTAITRSFLLDPAQFTVETIYIGGGTPSRLTVNEWRDLFSEIRRCWPQPWQECTVEANPEDLTPETLKLWRYWGVDRLSIGVQRLDAEGLRRLGRARSQAAVAALPKLLNEWRQMGGRTSLDLIYGLVGDQPLGIAEQVQQLLTWPIEHLSAYSLTIEPTTPFGRASQRGQQFAASAAVAAACYLAVLDTVEAHGWEAYEISNFCAPGQRARHNSSYWQGLPYMGYGLAAASFVKKPCGCSRYLRPHDWAAFLAEPAAQLDREILNTNNLLAERLLLGLRSFVGVPVSWLAVWRRRELSYVDLLIRDKIIFEYQGKILMPANKRLLAEELAARWLLALTADIEVSQCLAV